MASTLLGGLARVHQGGDRRGGEGGEGAYEGKSDDGFEACHGEVADRKRAGTGVGRVVAGVVWQSSSARHTTRGSRGRRFGGAMVAKQSLGSFGPYRRRLAMSFHHYIHTFTRLCLSCIAISRGPSPSHHSSISIAALATSHPSHVPQQLRQRFGHLVRPSLIAIYQPPLNPCLSSSPQGRIFQVEYAQEAVKQGSVVVGIVSKTHAVLAAVKVRRRTLPSAPCPPLTPSSIA
jgi:hypothetical protein